MPFPPSFSSLRPIPFATWRGVVFLVVGWWLCLPFARPAAEFLRERNLLAVTIWGCGGAAVGVLLAGQGLLAFRGRRGFIPLLTVMLAGGIASRLPLPEERLHLVEYGVLAWWIRNAVEGTQPGVRPLTAFLTTLFLAAALGWLEEGIQGILPSRHYDLRDVALNGAGALLGAVLSYGGTAKAPGVSWSRNLGGGLAGALLAVGVFGIWGALGGGDDSSSQVKSSSARSGNSIGITRNSPSPSPPPVSSFSPPWPGASVLLVTLDAFRGDRLATMGGTPSLHPALARLLRESIRVEGFRAPSTWTSPSLVSLFSGLHPLTHGVSRRKKDLGPSLTTPVSAFAAAGYTTVGHFGEVENYRHLGFTESLPQKGDPISALSPHLRGRFLVWQHLTDLHLPYEEPIVLPPQAAKDPLVEQVRSQWTLPRSSAGDPRSLLAFAPALYDAQFIALDRKLGQILALVDSLSPPPLLVVTTDHGEELGERGWVGHASTTLDSLPQEELLRIPLLVRLPDGRGGGQVRWGSPSLQDLLPTVAELVGVPVPSASPGVPLDGVSFAPWLLGHAGAEPPSGPFLASTSPCGWRCSEEPPEVLYHALLSGGWKILCREVSGTLGDCRLFDLVQDPGELHDASTQNPQWTQALRESLERILADGRKKGARLGTPVPSP